LSDGGDACGQAVFTFGAMLETKPVATIGDLINGWYKWCTNGIDEVGCPKSSAARRKS
jgi:hypothetical protein